MTTSRQCSKTILAVLWPICSVDDRLIVRVQVRHQLFDAAEGLSATALQFLNCGDRLRVGNVTAAILELCADVQTKVTLRPRGYPFSLCFNLEFVAQLIDLGLRYINRITCLRCFNRITFIPLPLDAKNICCGNS